LNYIGEFKPISSRYSEELRDLISSMIVVDPNKRVDSATVERKANEVYMILQEQQKTP
jgi:NIMA (never in mitosis gene a)-related kinase